ncbi:MAG TPA: hypothetical protein VF828_03040 [Patescibacteria group bacterium]
MKKNKLSLYFTTLSITTFAAVFIFLVQQSYNNLVGPSNEVRANSLLKPIDPNLDTATLDQVDKRRNYDNVIIPVTGLIPTPFSISIAPTSPGQLSITPTPKK